MPSDHFAGKVLAACELENLLATWRSRRDQWREDFASRLVQTCLRHFCCERKNTTKWPTKAFSGGLGIKGVPNRPCLATKSLAVAFSCPVFGTVSPVYTSFVPKPDPKFDPSAKDTERNSHPYERTTPNENSLSFCQMHVFLSSAKKPPWGAPTITLGLRIADPRGSYSP